MARKSRTENEDLNFDTTPPADETGQDTPPPAVESRLTPTPPADDDDFFSPENIRLAQEFAPVERSATLAIELRRPPGDSFIRCHPDPAYSLTWPVVEKDETVYVLTPKLAKQLESDPRMATSVKSVRFVLCAIYNGPFFLWAVKQPTDPSNQSTIQKAQDQAVAFGMAGWVRVTWNPKLKQHDCFPYVGPPVSDPLWPEKPFSELLKIAMGEARMIKSADHSVIRKLAGLEL